MYVLTATGISASFFITRILLINVPWSLKNFLTQFWYLVTRTQSRLGAKPWINVSETFYVNIVDAKYSWSNKNEVFWVFEVLGIKTKSWWYCVYHHISGCSNSIIHLGKLFRIAKLEKLPTNYLSNTKWFTLFSPNFTDECNILLT